MTLFDKYSEIGTQKLKELKSRGHQMRSEKERAQKDKFINAGSYLKGTDENANFFDRFKEAK